MGCWSRVPKMPGDTSPGHEQARAAELIAALCLATDLGTGLPFEHGLHSTVFAMRLADRLGVDADTATQTYYGCLLFYVGCTADAEIAADIFDDGALVKHSRRSCSAAGVRRSRASSGRSLPRMARRRCAPCRPPAGSRGLCGDIRATSPRSQTSAGGS